MNCCVYAFSNCYYNISFSSELMIRLNKLACYITTGWKDMLRTNTLAYWYPFKSYEEMV